MSRTARLAARAGGVLLLAALLAPPGYAVWVSFSPGELLEPPTGQWSLRWYREFANSPRWADALQNSLTVAALAALVATVAGTCAAVAVRRGPTVGAVLLPLFVPGVVLGMGLLPTAHALGVWGTTLSLALAHGLVGLPVVYLVVRAALAEAGPDLEAAARGLGAGPVRAFLRVTLPAVRPAVLAGAALSFLLSLNEFTLALFLATPDTETLPVVVWPNLRYGLSPLVAVASCVSMAAGLLGLGLAFGSGRAADWVRRLVRG
jgi:ABC-type spermidine/putrescine transport system permease subunit II